MPHLEKNKNERKKDCIYRTVQRNPVIYIYMKINELQIKQVLIADTDIRLLLLKNADAKVTKKSNRKAILL